DKDALKLTEREIKLLQIAALFHDAAREDEQEDRWDHESGLLLYYYLTRLLKVDKSEAKLFAEAIANKDVHPEFFVLEENPDNLNEVSWKKLTPTSQKNIYQKLLHDADCLDIIRTCDHFDAEHLDFYKEIASVKKNELANEEMAHLITEARSLIEIQGDSRY